MAHNIFGQRFLGKREPAWHNLGKVFTEDLDLINAFELAGMNYTVELWESLTRKDSDSNSFVIPDRYEVVRYPTVDDPVYQTWGQVSDQYKLVTNQDLALIYNDLSKQWPVETVGSLGKGETIFFTLDAGIVEINGEEIHQYFLITDNKMGKEGTIGSYTPVRVVCQNTLIMGLSQAQMKFNVMHKGNNLEKLNNIAELTSGMLKNVEYSNWVMGEMGKVKFNVADFEKLVKNILYPLPEVKEGVEVTNEFDKLFEKQKVTQSKVMTLFNEYQDIYPNIANTSWNAYNVITDYENYKPGRGNGKFNQVLWGNRADTMTQAFNYLTKIK